MKKMLTILALAAACCFAGCNDDTDDLWDEVNGLKSRVEALETQVQVLNDNIEALSALAQQGATITDAKEENGTWTLTLSNGQVVTLKQGSEAEAVVPVMGIDTEGYWVVDYRDGKGFVRILVDGKPVKSTAVDGFTPKFRIDANSCWEVSYDGGEHYESVLGADGKPVSAVGSGEVTDKFFADVKVEGDLFHVELLTGQSFDIPIVPDFYCRIVAPDGVQVFSSKETKRFEVQVNGVENVLISAPDGWSAQLTDMVDGKATLVVTAPETTRALADNTKDVTLLATAGYYACIAKIQVETAGGVVVTPPSVTSIAAVPESIGETSLTFTVEVSDDADAWMYLLQESSVAAPEASAIAASGKSGAGNEVTVSGLTASTGYVLYVIAIKNPNTYSEVKASDPVTTREHRDYVDYYEEGIVIDGVRYDSSNSVLVQESTAIAQNGVYFLDPADGAEITLKANGANGVGQLVLIGRKSNVKPEVTVNGIVSMSAKDASDGFVFKNVKLNATKHTNYVFNFDGVSDVFDRFIMEDCEMETPLDKPFSYFSKAGGIKKIMLTRNRIHINLSASDKQFNLFNFGGNCLVEDMSVVEFTDNVIYSDQDKVAKGFVCGLPNKANASLTVKMFNNTLVNYVGNPNAYVSAGAIGGITISKNAFWVMTAYGTTSYLCKILAASTAVLDLSDNVIFGLKEKGLWSSHTGTLPTGMDKKPALKVEETDPFASMNFKTGQFVLNAEHSGYGSSLK